MFLLRFIILIFFWCALFIQSAFCAEDYKIKELKIDNSDRLVVISGEGNYKQNQASVYVPIPNSSSNSLNLINDITTFTLTNPNRFVVDIPNSKLIGASRVYKISNSNTIKNITMSQFSINPNITRVVFEVNNQSDLSKIKVFFNGSDIFFKYNNSIIDNSLQYKFYTPNGDMDKTVKAQNTYATVVYNHNNETKELKPVFQNKYYLTQINQNSDGLILKGLGSISMIRPVYNDSNTRAVFYLDSATLSPKYEGKIFDIPSSQKENSARIALFAHNSKRIRIEMDGNALRDYRFVLSQDGQSLYISHRTYILNSAMASNDSKINSYKINKNSNGYWIFDINFNQSVVYDAFELGENFYLDVYNLSDFNKLAFDEAMKNLNVPIQATKISTDKTRYIISQKELNFSYANVESNAKSIKLCFKEKPQTAPNIIVDASKIPQEEIKKEEVIIPTSAPVKVEKDDLLDTTLITYVPKQEEKPKEVKAPKKKPEISSMKKVVIDPGHGGIDSGAIGGGVYEKDINLQVSLMLAEKLKKKNVYVYLTRQKDSTLTLEDRTNYSNEIAPDIYVSMHTNSTFQEDSYGLEVHYFKEDSLKLAQVVHENFVSEKNLKKWDTKDRGVIKSRFYVINHTEAPSVLIEIGFLSNEAEREKLIKKSRQEEIASSIAKGILEYLGIKW